MNNNITERQLVAESSGLSKSKNGDRRAGVIAVTLDESNTTLRQFTITTNHDSLLAHHCGVSAARQLRVTGLFALRRDAPFYNKRTPRYHEVSWCPKKQNVCDRCKSCFEPCGRDNKGDLIVELIVHDKDEQVVRLTITGGITQKQVSNSDDLLQKLVGKDVYTRKVLINLAENDYIDSSGINWLLIRHKRFIENRGQMVLHSIPQVVDNVLKILRMESVFDLAETEADALRKVEEERS